ncbi:MULTISPECIES: metal ABC transporter permease [Sutcliffiella]|uniref:Manganese transport system membrane protein MntC n=1 Tax=Sutcliffiella cohnii TaxID=33932 RepID=A0A223KUG3_9BACI|nr:MULTISPECIES: metal ABC transporter permease [Sutcliffiella]AST92968.1 manganese ABC transporter permease [Sutcliffiella cohnii]MED4016065.1 metal ABC transporter permease [Sutcliffiella cohnii]WBL14231.1 metal ABC transporter permease [Sutcliffiella sp. NC1]
MDFLLQMLQDPNVQWVLIGTSLLGIASGVLGSFALLRKQSLLGDAMAHAALPGICIAFLIYGAKSMSWFMIGAALSGLIGTYCIQAIIKHSRIKEDTAIGLVLSVFFGLGITLLTYIQQLGKGNQAGLDSFIFGQAASIVGSDVNIITTVSIILIATTILLFKELKLITFDAQFAQGIGLPVKWLNGLLMTLIVCAVVIGLQAVGVVLMAAMLITPAISARYWTERLDYMVIISGVIGGVSGVIGTLLSTLTRGMPTGPLIILAATMMFLFSLLFGVKRGVLFQAYKLLMVRKQVVLENILTSLYNETEKSLASSNCIGVVNIKESENSLFTPFIYKRLMKEKLISIDENYQIYLTEKGLFIAHEIVLKERLLDMYLMNESQFPELNWRESGYNVLNEPKELIQQLTHLLKEFGREPIALSLYQLKNSKERNYQMISKREAGHS